MQIWQRQSNALQDVSLSGCNSPSPKGHAPEPADKQQALVGALRLAHHPCDGAVGRRSCCQHSAVSMRLEERYSGAHTHPLSIQLILHSSEGWLGMGRCQPSWGSAALEHSRAQRHA